MFEFGRDLLRLHCPKLHWSQLEPCRGAYSRTETPHSSGHPAPATHTVRKHFLKFRGKLCLFGLNTPHSITGQQWEVSGSIFRSSTQISVHADIPTELSLLYTKPSWLTWAFPCQGDTSVFNILVDSCWTDSFSLRESLPDLSLLQTQGSVHFWELITKDKGKPTIQNLTFFPLSVLTLRHLTLCLESQTQPLSGHWYSGITLQTQVRGEDPVTTAV